MVRGFRSLILRRLAGGGPSLSELEALRESIPSGTGEPTCDDSCERGGDGYAIAARSSGGGEGVSLAGELRRELRSESER